jgi:hypothetical protein
VQLNKVENLVLGNLNGGGGLGRFVVVTRVGVAIEIIVGNGDKPMIDVQEDLRRHDCAHRSVVKVVEVVVPEEVKNMSVN